MMENQAKLTARVLPQAHGSTDLISLPSTILGPSEAAEIEKEGDGGNSGGGEGGARHDTVWWCG